MRVWLCARAPTLPPVWVCLCFAAVSGTVFSVITKVLLPLSPLPGQPDGPHGDEETPALRDGREPSLAAPAERPVPCRLLRAPGPPAVPDGSPGSDPRNHGGNAVPATAGSCPRTPPQPLGARLVFVSLMSVWTGLENSRGTSLVSCLPSAVFTATGVAPLWPLSRNKGAGTRKAVSPEVSDSWPPTAES